MKDKIKIKKNDLYVIILVVILFSGGIGYGLAQITTPQFAVMPDWENPVKQNWQPQDVSTFQPHAGENPMLESTGPTYPPPLSN